MTWHPHAKWAEDVPLVGVRVDRGRRVVGRTALMLGGAVRRRNERLLATSWALRAHAQPVSELPAIPDRSRVAQPMPRLPSATPPH